MSGKRSELPAVGPLEPGAKTGARPERHPGTTFLSERVYDTTYRPVWEPTEEPLSLDLEQAAISSIIWCIGYRPDFGWLDAPRVQCHGSSEALSRSHRPAEPLFPPPALVPWLYTWGSGRFSGIARDARYLAEPIDESWRMPDAGCGRATARRKG
jgi:hypothetical protein